MCATRLRLAKKHVKEVVRSLCYDAPVAEIVADCRVSDRPKTLL